MGDGVVPGAHTPTADGDGAAPEGGRVHVPDGPQTLERARAAIRAALAEQACSAAALGYAAAVVADASRARQQSAAGRAERAEPQSAVGDHARRLRVDGVPPQGMLVLVKAALRDSTPPGTGALEARQTLTADVVRWSIEAYYDAV